MISKLTIEKCFLIIVVMICAISVNGKHLSQKTSARKSCGRALVERVQEICQNRGGHMTYTSARAQRHVRRSIVNECCANKCADYQLYAYCSNDAEVSSSEKASESEPQGTQLNDSQNMLEETTAMAVELTTELNMLNFERKTKNPHFQFGTVPPEYRISPFVPSQSRLLI